MYAVYYLLLMLITISPVEHEEITETGEYINSDNVPQRTVEVIGINKMKFVVKKNNPGVVVGDTVTTIDGQTFLTLEAIKVEPGSRIKITLTTKSKLPPRSMSHNWILLKQEADPADFDKEAVLAVDNNYIPPHKEDEIIAHTGLAAGGETVSTTFITPQKQGMYDYLCSFPGHFANDMRGKLIVQEQ